MKQVLVTCDSCAKVVPAESIRKWWGLLKTDGDVPDMRFTPLRPDNLDQFKSHACSEQCLVKLLMAFAESVDMKKAAAAKTERTFSFLGLMGYPGSLSSNVGGANDSIGYYKKPEDDDDDEDGGGK